jgi:RNA polymerase sigma-70 factor (ECF subfamily)
MMYRGGDVFGSARSGVANCVNRCGWFGEVWVVRAFSTDGAGQVISSDAELIAASLTDRRVFAGLFDRHYAAVAGFLRRRLERSLADDLAAETFLQAFDGRGRYDVSRADARPWLFGIASHLLARHRRGEERRLRAFARAGQVLGDDRGLDDADRRMDAAAAAPVLAAALASLGAGDREVLLLYAWADLSYEEISVALALPVGTVRSRLHRARARVRRELEAGGVAHSLVVMGDGDGVL